MLTRSVDDLVATMDVGSGLSKSQASRICQGLDERVDAVRNRTLALVAFPYVCSDPSRMNVRDDALGQVILCAVVIATGSTAYARHEVLGVDIDDSEDETFWTWFPRSLHARGLRGGPSGDLRRARRARGIDPQVLHRGVLATSRGALRPKLDEVTDTLEKRFPVKRRSNVVRIFPDDDAAVRLIGAALAEHPPRMGHRPPLPLRSIDSRTRPATRHC